VFQGRKGLDFALVVIVLPRGHQGGEIYMERGGVQLDSVVGRRCERWRSRVSPHQPVGGLFTAVASRNARRERRKPISSAIRPFSR
jgi:hypothetical protein